MPLRFAVQWTCLALGLLMMVVSEDAAVDTAAPAVVGERHVVLGSVFGFRLHVFMPPANNLTANAEGFSPTMANASHPVVFFVTGFAGDTPAVAYGDLLSGLAAHGIAVVAAERFGKPDYPKEGHDFRQVLLWAQSGGLQESLQKHGMALQRIDVEKRSAVMGHSAGNHVVGQALQYGCAMAKAFVLLDPVDGFDPYRFVKSQDLITPGHKLNFSIPALILDNSLDSKALNSLVPPCAPEALGAARWFPAMQGPVWNIHAKAYGHLDCLDGGWARAGSWLCPSNAQSDKAAYKTFLADTTSWFLKALLDWHQEDLALFDNASQFGVEVSVRKDLKGARLTDIVPGCTGGGLASSSSAMQLFA